MNGSISVVIPTYNRAVSLAAAVRSALSQSLRPLEVLVCDDGSTDGGDGREAVAALGEADVRWLECGRNGRPAAPRNRGLREARGEWIAFLDDDDVWHGTKLERQAAALEGGFEAVCANAVRRDARGLDLGPLHAQLPPSAGLKELLAANFIVTSGAMVRRRLLLECGGFPESSALYEGEDYALWLRVASRTRWVFVAEPLLDYRDAPNESIRRATAGRQWKPRRRVMADLLRWSLGRRGATGTAVLAARAWLRAALRHLAWDGSVGLFLPGDSSRALKARLKSVLGRPPGGPRV